MVRSHKPDTDDIISRVSSLETSVQNLHDVVSEIKQGIETIKVALQDNAKTNWNLILTAGFLILAVWAAAIHPLSDTLDNQKATAATLADAVLKQNDKINELHTQQAIDDANFINLEERLNIWVSPPPRSNDR